MRNMILPLIVNIWPEIMLAEREDDSGAKGGSASRSSFTTTKREERVIKLSIAAKRHALRVLSHKSNS
jgi:hypothetical protein